MSGEWFKIEGDRKQIIDALANSLSISNDEAEKVFAALLKENTMLLDDETCNQVSHKGVGGLSFVTRNCEYFINIRVATIYMITSLIDSRIRIPATGLYMTVRGMKQMIARIDETTGERCIIIEILRSEGKKGDESLLDVFFGECCNNQLRCRYKKDGTCGCTHNDIHIIMERLFTKGILKKQNEEYYYSLVGTL